MRQGVQVYVTIKLKGLGQRFEESDEGDRQMGFGVVHCCSPIPVFCFLYSKILPVTKMRLNVCFNEKALFGLFAALIKGCSSYDRNGGQSTRGDD